MDLSQAHTDSQNSPLPKLGGDTTLIPTICFGAPNDDYIKVTKITVVPWAVEQPFVKKLINFQIFNLTTLF